MVAYGDLMGKEIGKHGEFDGDFDGDNPISGIYQDMNGYTKWGPRLR